MFLLIPDGIKYYVSSSKFTFHYVSTYTRTAVSGQRSITHLHSTMFLLIPIQAPKIYKVFKNLHSTMFLLIPTLPRYTTHYTAFTFHYVSTYTIMRALISCSFIIYIPLCFYLYGENRSTILSTYLIYIPLCFYLYRISDKSHPLPCLIYIPLCFYLY